jgi:uncharacterized protein (TIGR02996 family)
MLFIDDETALREVCYANLGDDAPWGIYADWLRERGRDTMADRMPELRRVLLALLPVALPIAERLPD